MQVRLCPDPLEPEALLAVTPGELSQALLLRRQALKEELPNVIRTLEAEEESLEPRVQRIVTSHRSTNDKVSELKKKRNRAQKEAGAVLGVVRGARDSLAVSGKVVNLTLIGRRKSFWMSLSKSRIVFRPRRWTTGRKGNCSTVGRSCLRRMIVG